MSKTAKKPPKQASARSQIPTPFTKAPTSAAAFLDRLDPAHVHITHIDRFPATFKRKIFAIPVLLNAAIALLLLWRAYIALPKYFVLVQTLLGYTTSETVDTIATPRSQQIRILLRRTFVLFLDFLLFRFVGPWPLTFFLERPANPCSWRWNLGFQEEEIVVRISRGWGTEELMQGVKQGNENPFFKTRILPGIEWDVVAGKTGYLSMSKDWDLEFEVMCDTHALVEDGKVKIGELDRVVWAFQEGVGWVMWKWEGEDDAMEKRRKKVVEFKEKLTKMGKESLFWRWTEIVEEERSTDGGFTKEKQEKVARRVQAEFEQNGVDFEGVVASIGGLEAATPDA